MEFVSINVDAKLKNTPVVEAVVLLQDGTESRLTFRDDEARQICRMVPNPNGEGTIATGEFSLPELESFADKRILENSNPKDFSGLLRAAEDARTLVKNAETAKVALEAEATAKSEEIARLETEAAIKREEVARLNAEAAAKADESARLDQEIADKARLSEVRAEV